MSEPESVRLAELPERPTGWTKDLVIHLNFGGGKGSATYRIHDPGWLSWSELREAYGDMAAIASVPTT